MIVNYLISRCSSGSECGTNRNYLQRKHLRLRGGKNSILQYPVARRAMPHRMIPVDRKATATGNIWKQDGFCGIAVGETRTCVVIPHSEASHTGRNVLFNTGVMR